MSRRLACQGPVPRLARLAGVLLQALVLGTLLFVAACNLIVTSGGMRLFRYENF